MILPLAFAVLLMPGCGFHLRKEAELPAEHAARAYRDRRIRRVALASDLAHALERSGTEIVDNFEYGVAVMSISAQQFVHRRAHGRAATRARNEYALRHHVELRGAGRRRHALLPKQTIELTREFTFDATQAVGVAAEIDLLTQELSATWSQTILRRLEALCRRGS